MLELKYILAAWTTMSRMLKVCHVGQISLLPFLTGIVSLDEYFWKAYNNKCTFCMYMR
jgi:hypothetical protein